jgi:putative NIF3 family GTP cyclohydrolase 1 type 2
VIGIHGSWAQWLGFHNPPLKQGKFNEVHDVSGRTLQDIAKLVADHLKILGQECVHVVGNLDQEVSCLALGTGAITNYRQMATVLGADVLLLTDDGTRLWESAQWAEDAGFPLLVVNHDTAEEPGVRAMAAYFREQFPDVPVTAVERGCLYRTIE